MGQSLRDIQLGYIRQNPILKIIDAEDSAYIHIQPPFLRIHVFCSSSIVVDHLRTYQFKLIMFILHFFIVIVCQRLLQ